MRIQFAAAAPNIWMTSSYTVAGVGKAASSLGTADEAAKQQ
jgi:hypothetical protein